MNEEDVLAFLSATVKSLWMLELLLLMRQQRERPWATGALVMELRASTVIIQDAIAGLIGAGLVARDDRGLFCYCPASETLDSFVADAQALYAVKPLAVINAIATAPNEKLRIFADAFRLKD